MDIGIDQIGFYTPNKFVDMVDLANARNQDPNKFLIGIGQDRMAVADKTQDAVSMGINATAEYLDQVDLEQLGLLIFATESGIDQSKSASLFVKEALNLPARIRTFEIKEACFALTASLQVARDYVRAHPHHSAMIIGSDIAHAVPLTLVAGIGHWFLGSVDWSLLGSLLIGSLPGIWLGSHISTRVPDRVLRPILAGMLVLVGSKLIAA